MNTILDGLIQDSTFEEASIKSPRVSCYQKRPKNPSFFHDGDATAFGAEAFVSNLTATNEHGLWMLNYLIDDK